MIKSKKILAVASGGGHFIQLLRLRPAFVGHQVSYVTTIDGYEGYLDGAECFIVRDASRWSKANLFIMSLQMFMLFLRIRPEVVITTGAAPGVFAICFGKLLRAKVLWLDSIANAEEVSMSGRLAGPYADLWLTQWPELVSKGGPEYKGRVL